MTKTSHLFEHILTHYRGLFATLVLLPVSALYSAYTGARNQIVFHLKSAPAKHEQRVQKVIRQIEDWKNNGALKNSVLQGQAGKP